MFASSANSTFNITVTGPSYPTGLNLSFVMVNGEVLAPCSLNATACLCNLIPGDYNVTETPPYGWGAVNITNDDPAVVAAGDMCGVNATEVIVTNTLLIPSTNMTVFTYVYDTVSGNVEITITDCNDGDAPIKDAVVNLRANNITYPFSPMGNSSMYFQGGDDSPPNGILDPGECWTWLVNVTIYEDTFFEVWGNGTDPLGNPVTYDPDTGEGYEWEYRSFRIEVGNATRTWGFWKTHLWLVEYMLGNSTTLNISDPYWTADPIVPLPIYLGNWNGQNMTVNNTCEYMALMWAKQSHNSDGTKRTQLDSARIHTAHQALAAIMNYYMPGGAPLPDGITLESIAATLSSNNITAIRDLGSDLAEYNESGDDEALDPDLPPTGRVYDDNIADPQGAKLVAVPCETHWDTPVASSATARGKAKGKNK